MSKLTKEQQYAIETRRTERAIKKAEKKHKRLNRQHHDSELNPELSKDLYWGEESE